MCNHRPVKPRSYVVQRPARVKMSEGALLDLHLGRECLERLQALDRNRTNLFESLAFFLRLGM